MSRRRGEFEHRTSIFEGAFRAWSHLGGLEPHDLETKTVQELDPLTHPLDNDARLVNGKGFKASKSSGDGNDEDDEKTEDECERGGSVGGGSGGGGGGSGSGGGGSGSGGGGSGSGGGGDSNSSKRREYPYEPLPRSGLAHPFVQAILSPWLGPDAEQDAIQLGLTTLRTWWQHRRKGESGSAVAALGTDKMRGVVEGYTRHFFNLAHCLVTNDGEQPPRTLHSKMKQAEKVRNKRNKKRAREEEAGKLATLALNAGLAHGLGGVPGLSGIVPGVNVAPQGLNLGSPSVAAAVAATVGQNSATPADANGLNPNLTLTPLERLHATQRHQLTAAGHLSDHTKFLSNARGKCVPGKVDLPRLANTVNTQATQLAYRGVVNPSLPISATPLPTASNPSVARSTAPTETPSSTQYGDPTTTPVVFASENGDIQIAMSVDGITCSHCVKIVETVLKGCNGNKSPILGLLDAAADQKLKSVLVKIDMSSNAKRIAFESARNLAMVGYTAKAKEMSILEVFKDADKEKGKADLSVLSTAFEVVAATDPMDVFDWKIQCTCPDNGILRDDCPRHSQMNTRIFEAFDKRQAQVAEFMSSCGKKTGGKCTCGPNCRCIGCDCVEHNKQCTTTATTAQPAPQSQSCCGGGAAGTGGGGGGGGGQQQSSQDLIGHKNSIHAAQPMHIASRNNSVSSTYQQKSSSRNNSMSSVHRHFSVNSGASETTFRRAMSGLSALSIDWENMEDFDVNIDHSAHINNIPITEEKDTSGVMGGCAMLAGGTCNCGPTCVCVGCPVHDKSASETSHITLPSNPTSQKRSSLRNKNAPIDPEVAQNMQVSFKV